MATLSDVLTSVKGRKTDPRTGRPLPYGQSVMGGRVRYTDPALEELKQFGLLPTKAPEYQGLPVSQVQGALGRIERGYNTSDIDALRARATATGESPWAAMQREKLGGDATAQAMSGVLGARSQLAQKGGLSRGAAERLAASGARNALGARRQIAQDISLADEQQKLELLKALPGLETQKVQTQLALSSPWMELAGRDALARNQFGLDRFKTQMGAYGAAKTGKAIQESGGGSSGILNDDVPVFGWL